MNRRSFFVFAAVFMMILLEFSFALAEGTTVDFEPMPVSWLKMGIADMEGNGAATTSPEDGSGNLNGDLSVKFNLTDKQWQGLLYNSRDLQYIYWPFEINLPDGTAAKAFVETKYGEDADINFLKTMEYEELPPSGAKISWPVKIANVNQQGTKAIITPESYKVTYLFKLKDNSSNELFYRINLQIAHEDAASIEVDSAAPAEGRLAFNVGQNKLDNVSYEYKDGIVTYYVEKKQDTDAVIKTTIKRPDSNAVKVLVNGSPYGAELSESNPTVGLGIAAHKDTEERITYKLQWLDSEGKEVASPDIITIKTLPAYMGMWTDTAWTPAAEEWLLEDDGISHHLEYSDGCWTFEVNPNNVDTLDADRYCDPVHLMYVPIPEDAKYFKMTGGNASRDDFDWAENVKNSLDKSAPILINNAETETSMKLVEINGQKALAAHFGSIFTKSSFKNDNLDVYVVNEDVTGHGTYRIIEWFDEGGNQIYFGKDKDKCGQYIYMEKKPYMKTAETKLEFDKDTSVSPKPGEAYAIVWDCQPDKVGELQSRMFRCEVPLQKDTHGNHRYVYQKLDLIDADGNVVELPEGTTIKVVLPYPEGLNKDNTKLEHFDVWHYEDESHSKHESMRKNGSLALEDIGITFITDSFSPFLLSYEPKETSDSSSGGSGISVTYNGGNSFSTSNSAVPTSVEIDGIPVSFTGDGRSFTVSSIPAGAKWITVRWNSTSITTNFAPDGNVVSAGIEIPKTGDISLLMPVLALIGAAAARCRRSSK